MKLSLNSQIVIAKNVVSCDLQGETAILNMENGVYYGLDEVGTRIWNLIQKPIKVENILKELLMTYDVDREECQRDLYDLLNEMDENGLLEVKMSNL